MDFSYNENEALQGGASGYITQTGAYVVKITMAKWTVSQSGAEALELSIETENSEKLDYLSIYYRGKDGNVIDFGRNMIQSLMGCTGVKKLSRQPTENALIAPELIGKSVGLCLQKHLYTKQDGSDGFYFKIIQVYSAKSGLTLSEHKNNEPAKRVAYLISTMKDKDEREKPKRTKQSKPKNETNQANEATAQLYGKYDFDDDVPF
ncbi:hypothetical protein ACWIUH_06690 [Ursidibacter arcticus]|uniref:hypothetical protein n=1 Tax=Ursidibacter arcticus TaxID=1524965 RepID=UPI0012FC94FC|nr:hypothetical protein [Ursidibacter arcticus]KAE9535314.1 hypothetical protein A1D25_05045 [Ursidibacter arcticus]